MIYLIAQTNMVNVDLRSIRSIYTIEGYEPDDTVCNDAKTILFLNCWYEYFSCVLF